MKKLLYILFLFPFLSMSQGSIIWYTDFETDQWSLSGGSNIWEYEADRGIPRTTDHVSAAISSGRSGTGRAIWLGDYNSNSTRNEVGSDRMVDFDEHWIGFSMYVTQATQNSRPYAQWRPVTASPNQGVVNSLTLRQGSTGQMYWNTATDLAEVDVVHPSGAGTGAEVKGTFNYNLNEWIDIVIHQKLRFGAAYDDTGAPTSWDEDGYFQIWVNGDLIVDHTGTTVYRYSNNPDETTKLEFDGDVTPSFGPYWSSLNSPQGDVYYDEYKVWAGAGGTYEDVSPLGLSPGGGQTPPIVVTGANAWPTSDKMLVAETRQAYRETVPTGATIQTGSWSTSNAAVATVNSSTGLITAQGVGSCTITWTSDDTTSGTITDTVAVTVESSSTEDSIMVLKPQGYYTPSSGDADSWDDTSGFELHGTEVGTITFTDEASFDGSSYYDLPESEFLDYSPTVDEFTIIYREGDTAPTTSGYAIAKRGVSSDFEYGAMAYIGGNIENYYIGGGDETAAAAVIDDNRLVILVAQTDQVNVWVDGVHVIVGSTAIGSQTYTGSANIGGRTDGSYLLNNGATLDIVAIIPKAINTAEREAIESEFQVNGAEASNSTKPKGGLNGNPVFYNGTTKKLFPQN